MRKLLFLLMFGQLMLMAACTTAPDKGRPKILCPACGTELDSIYHRHF